MTSIIKGLLNSFFKVFFFVLFVIKAKSNNSKSLYIFDIDNTVGDTFPTLLNVYNSESERLLSIPMFPRMKALITKLQKSPSRKIMFITARSYKCWQTTRQWFLLNGLEINATDIIIVPNPAEKVFLLGKILPLEKGLTLIDDMSWNHENGNVKFYQNEIEALSKLPLRYIGYNTIKRFIKS